MSTRAIIAYPYRTGYRGAWVWSDGMPSHIKPLLRTCATNPDKVRLLVKFGNIDTFMTEAQLQAFKKQFPNIVYIYCKAFMTKNALDAYLSVHSQYKKNVVCTLKSGLCLLTDKDNDSYCNIVADVGSPFVYFVTNIGGYYVMQVLRHVEGNSSDDTNYAFYPNIQYMQGCDINHVYVYNPEKNVWRLRDN